MALQRGQPGGAARFYEDHQFPTAFEVCEAFGHDLATGGLTGPAKYKAADPEGKAFLNAAEYHPPHEAPDEKYLFWAITERQIHYFHTRTKTGRSEKLREAAL